MRSPQPIPAVWPDEATSKELVHQAYQADCCRGDKWKEYGLEESVKKLLARVRELEAELARVRLELSENARMRGLEIAEARAADSVRWHQKLSELEAELARLRAVIAADEVSVRPVEDEP